MPYSSSFQILEYELNNIFFNDPIEIYKQRTKAWIGKRKADGYINGENLELFKLCNRQESINYDYEGYDSNEYSLYEFYVLIN